MRGLIIILFCFGSSLLFGQITGVDYLMKYNCETNQYDVKIVVLGGSATTIPQRAQFNAQISLVVPTGETVEITEHYMPLQNNQNYTGTIPINWWLGTPKISPQAQPENDFYGVTPTLSPASLYNNLQENDIVKLFSFTAGITGQYDENVRFFNNDEDPNASDTGMGGNDFKNGFTIGSSTQLYQGNSVESCVTSVEKVSPIQVSVYPNPFQNQFTIELPSDIKQISVLGSAGERYYRTISSLDEVLTINAFNYTRGVYFIVMEFNDGTIKSQRILKL